MATPLEISILLHYAIRTTDFRDGNFSAPAVASAIREFEEMGLIRKRTGSDIQTYDCTKYVGTVGARFYLEKLCEIPFPVRLTKWEIPHEFAGNEASEAQESRAWLKSNSWLRASKIPEQRES